MVAVFVSLLYPLIMHAQTIEEIIQDEEQYIWGEGLGATQKEAKENALHDLSSKISLHVSSVDVGYISNEQ